jgi:RNA polymerase primary sigma factor
VSHHRDGRDDDPSLRAYLRELQRLPATTPDEERALGARIRDHGDEAAVRRLVEGNLRFVVSYAKRYRHLGVPFLDLIHQGNLGLIEAARRFDPTRNVKFITYAVWWVRQSIVQLLSGQARAFSLPPKLSPVAARFGRDVATLAGDLHRVPTADEIAAELNISLADAAALLHLRGTDVSLNEPIRGEDGETGTELGEVLEGPGEDTAESVLVRDALVAEIRRALGELDPKEREVMQLRHGIDTDEPWTLQQIGDRLNLSRERVRQIEARALTKLRRSKRLKQVAVSLN